MKYTKLIWVALCATVLLLMGVCEAMAQAVSDPPPLPTNIASFWHLAIMVVTPIVVYLARLAVPKIPRQLLPISTPLIGIVLGVALNYFAGLNLGWWDSAAAGAVGVAIRESVNQIVTKRLAEQSDG